MKIAIVASLLVSASAFSIKQVRLQMLQIAFQKAKSRSFHNRLRRCKRERLGKTYARFLRPLPRAWLVPTRTVNQQLLFLSTTSWHYICSFAYLLNVSIPNSL